MKKILLIICCFYSLNLFSQSPVFEWAKQLGEIGDDEGNAIATDPLGNVLVTGSFRGIVDFDPGPNVFNLNSKGSNDIFVAKFNASGQFIWAASFGDTNNDGGYGITTDAIGNVYATGSFGGMVDFDPGPGTYYISSEGIFVLKLDTNGSFIWAKSMGVNSYGIGQAIVVDDIGNVYTTGYFEGTVDFDPGLNIYNLTSNGWEDIFISKLNSNGDFVWAKSMGGEDSDFSYSIALDSDSNVFTTGYFDSDVMAFDPGPNQFNITAIGVKDLFISKLDNEGNFVWTKNIGGASNGIVEAYDIAVDQTGNVYTTGGFYGIVDFDPGPDQFNIDHQHDRDLFISKLDNDGNFVWAKNIGGGYDEPVYGYGIVTDQNGNVYTTGFFEGSVDFDPGPGYFGLNSSYDDEYDDPMKDFFVLKLNTEGSFIWAVDFDGDGSSSGASISIDDLDNVYTTGSFRNSRDFDYSCNLYELTPLNGNTDAFIHKINQLSCGGASLIINNSNPSFGICLGDSISLNAEMPCWVENLNYSWGSGENSESIVVSPELSSIYNLEANYTLDTAVCSTSLSIEVQVFENAVEIPYNGFDDDCDETTLDDDLDQDGLNLAQDCDDNNPNLPTTPGTPCDDGNNNTYSDIIQLDGCTCTGNSNNGEIPIFEWVRQIGGDNNQSGSDITTDYLGNIFVVGSFRGNVDFDPGFNDYYIESEGSYDIYVTKFNPSGQLIWAVSFGNSSTDHGGSISTDTLGNIYITGIFEGTVDFDPGPETYNLTSFDDENDYFILKLDSNGSFIWANSLDVNGRAIATDKNSNIYITGSFGGIIDFDPGPNIFNLSSNGSSDIFILKLNSEGSFSWAKSIGGEDSDLGNSIFVDKYHNVYTTGAFRDTVDLDPGIGTHIVSSKGKEDLFVLKLNDSGDFIWVKSVGSFDERVEGYGIAVDDEENVHIIGNFSGTVDFDPGPDTFNLTGSYDVFVLKLDEDGEYQWTNLLVANSNLMDITLDKFNNVYTTNTYGDLFIRKFNPNGSFIWAGSIDVNTGSRLTITLDDWNNIYTTGFYITSSTEDFDPGLGVFELSSDDFDAFIHKMSQQCPGNPTINGSNPTFAICPEDSIITLNAEMPSWAEGISYFWSTGETTDSIVVMQDSSSTYYLEVNYTVDTATCFSSALVNVTVVDSITIMLTDNLELCELEVVTLDVSGGTSYFWSTGDSTNQISIIAEESQLYNVTVTDNYGCTETDSVAVLVNPLSDTTYLEFITCDSLEAGSFSLILLDQNGCDSILVVDSILLLVPEMPVAPPDLLIQENEPPFQLTIPEVQNATEYFWVVPPGVQILSGAGTNTIIIDWGGITTGGFVCVSAINACGGSPPACIEVTLDIIDGAKDSIKRSYSIFPNPTSSHINIIFDNIQAYEITLFDILGRSVIPPTNYLGQAQLDISQIAGGNYWLKISKNGEVFWERIEVQR